MKLQLASDLHTELYRDGGASIIKTLPGTNADVLILAGDILNAKDKKAIRFVLGTLSARYENVIYVPGNHEFYGTTPTMGWANLNEVAAELKNVHIPDNAVIEVSGQRFVVGTGWFPMPNPVQATARRYMNDFYQIKDFEPWVYNHHADFEVVLTDYLRPTDVVITHHLPTFKSTPVEFQTSPLNPFFLGYFERFIHSHQPALWVHGHTHTRCDYQIGKTRVVSNPLGYPSEPTSQSAFDPQLTITV